MLLRRHREAITQVETPVVVGEQKYKLDQMTILELKDLAKKNNVELGKTTLKKEIISLVIKNLESKEEEVPTEQSEEEVPTEQE